MRKVLRKSFCFLLIISIISSFALLHGASAEGGAVLPGSVTGKNWMSAVEDSKKLYEINIPGTHDSAMAYCKNSTNNYVKLMGIPLVNSGEYAKTQVLSIGEQLDAGVRFFDLRFGAKKGELRLCHGDLDDVKAVNDKLWILDLFPIFAVYELLGMPFVDLDTEFYAFEDEKCKTPSTYDTAIETIKEFLEENPSETIILKLKRENGEYAPYINLLKAKIDTLRQQKNSSTGKPFLYTENGNGIYSFMPSLAETRGQIILLTPDFEALQCGNDLDMYNGTGMNEYMGMYFNFHNHWDIEAEQKRDEVKTYIEENSRDVSGGEKAIYGSILHTSSNVVMKDSPADIEKTVGEWLYADGTLKSGHFYGWFLSDFLDKEKAEKIWKTNMA